MEMILAILFIFCVCFGLLYIRLCGDIRSLSAQLEEIRSGSHMELTVNSRQKPLLMLCRKLNRVLTEKDGDHIRYENAQKQVKENITSLAHDIRTPLTGAAGYMQLARECEETARREHYLDAAQKRLTELEDMLEQMFLYTKLSGEEFSLAMTEVQVVPLLGDCLLGMYAQFEELGVSPNVTFESEGFCVRADEEALRRVFLNLIRNALLYGTGDITISQKRNSVVFENPVSGECDLNPERIFERFYKGDKARRKGASGLGLYIVKELMRKMEGDARVDLEEGRFSIMLDFKEI
jgi:signal transduction histidine kinase